MSTTERQNRDPFALAREAGRREVFGYVARDNIDSVLLWVRDLLWDDEGDPVRYTWVACYEYAGFRPEVRTGQLAEAISIPEPGHDSITVSDSYGVWGLHGDLPSQPRSRRGEKALRRSCYIVVSDRHLQVRFRTPEGKLAWWHVQVEEKR